MKLLLGVPKQHHLPKDLSVRWQEMTQYWRKNRLKLVFRKTSVQKKKN